MATYSWPDNLYPTEFGFSRFEAGYRQNSMFQQNGQTIGLLNDRWMASLRFGIQSRVDSRIVEAFVNSLRQGVHNTLVPHFFRPQPLGTLQGVSSLSANAAQGASTFSIVAANGTTLLAGDFFNVGTMLFCVAENAVASGGVITVTVVNPSRRAWPSGTAVIFSSPTCVMRLVPNSTAKPTYQSAWVLGGMALDFVEDVTV